MIIATFLLAACSGPIPRDSASSADQFCSDLNDGGTYVTAPGGGNTVSGRLELRVLSGESLDPYDPMFVAFKEYTLENLDSGGVKTVGQTSGDGLVNLLLGAGNWRFSAAYTRGSLTCLAVLDAPVVAGETTTGCAVMECP